MPAAVAHPVPRWRAPYRALTERQLVTAMQRPDDLAVAEFCARYASPLRAVALTRLTCASVLSDDDLNIFLWETLDDVAMRLRAPGARQPRTPLLNFLVQHLKWEILKHLAGVARLAQLARAQFEVGLAMSEYTTRASTGADAEERGTSLRALATIERLHLSPGECELLALMAEGGTARDVGQALGLTEVAVWNRRLQLRRRGGVGASQDGAQAASKGWSVRRGPDCRLEECAPGR